MCHRPRVSGRSPCVATGTRLVACSTRGLCDAPRWRSATCGVRHEASAMVRVVRFEASGTPRAVSVVFAARGVHWHYLVACRVHAVVASGLRTSPARQRRHHRYLHAAVQPPRPQRRRRRGETLPHRRRQRHRRRHIDTGCHGAGSHCIALRRSSSLPSSPCPSSPRRLCPSCPARCRRSRGTR
jgi:hypothetical protein